LSRLGYDHHCLSFVYSCVLLLVVFLALCILVVGGVAYIYMCGFLVDRIRWCFEFVCQFVYICVLFSFLCFVLLCFCFWLWLLDF